MLNRSLTTLESERSEAEARFVSALDACGITEVKVMSRVRDALNRRDGLSAAARLLKAWADAGGTRTAERGAWQLEGLASAASTFVVAQQRCDRLREANRLRLAYDMQALPVA